MTSEFNSQIVEGTDTGNEIQLVETSTSRSQASTSHINEFRLDIEDKKLLKQLGQQTEKLGKSEGQRIWPNEKNRAEIHRVPKSILRNVSYEDYFSPRELSIGPIHAAYRHRKLKLQLAAHFILESGSTMEDMFKDFKSKIDIKACFDEKIKLYIKDEPLMRLLFLDGCAMLGFIHSYVNQKLNMFDISNDRAALIEQDLLLLENQIPFQVLEVLIGFGTALGNQNLKESFLIFIFLISNDTFPRESSKHLYAYMDRYFSTRTKKNQKPVHALELFREVLLYNASSFYYFEYMVSLIRNIFWILCSCGCVAICCMLERFKQGSYHTISWRKTKQFFHTVQELKAAGIEFKPSESLTAISFHSRFFIAPRLMLPTLVIDESTEHKLFNLVAFEMCLSESRPNEKPWITSYVNLIDSLIDNEQDVKDLRAVDTLRNTLSTDKDAAELINNIGARCFAPTEDAYVGVKDKIENYYRTKCATWMAQVCDAHFSSPWNILALFAATLLLVLTAVQTWYAIDQKN